ncbi:MAG: FAD-dependent monooxygenase [Rhodospirillales bacterium]|nr:FAD-dependent monooxygenase [Rhodospirillales bacterium]
MTGGSTGGSAKGLRVVIVGGSMGGLLAGNMLHRAGCDVTVHERIDTELAERGAGIATHSGLHAALESLGLSIQGAFGNGLENRITLGTDGSILARHHLPQIMATWGHLYRLLRSNFPEDRYVAGSNFTRFEQRGEGVLARFEDGSSVQADLLIGADGVRSTVRPQLWPEAVPEYAGYVAWRGILDEDRLSPEHRDILLSHFIVCLPPGEHVVGYPVAGADGGMSPGRRRFNIVWYRLTTAEQLQRMQTDASGHYHEAGIAPDLIERSWIDEVRRAAEERLPPCLAEPMNLAHGIFFQTIVDLEVPRMVRGRVAMLGDAAFSARPHTGMGVVKATGDAVRLAEAIEANPGDLTRALSDYDEERTRYGRSLVRFGRQLGTHIETPGRSAEDRALGDYLRQPENVIQAISIPPPCSPLKVFREDAHAG